MGTMTVGIAVLVLSLARPWAGDTTPRRIIIRPPTTTRHQLFTWLHPSPRFILSEPRPNKLRHLSKAPGSIVRIQRAITPQSQIARGDG